MKNVKLFISAFIFLAMTGTAWSKVGMQCPGIDAIQAVGVSHADTNNGVYAVTEFNKYGTDQSWGFGISNIHDAGSKLQALINANTALSTLNFKQGPVAISSLNGISILACFYNIGYGYNAVALTVG
jgi:hypothetical protein